MGHRQRRIISTLWFAVATVWGLCCIASIVIPAGTEPIPGSFKSYSLAVARAHAYAAVAVLVAAAISVPLGLLVTTNWGRRLPQIASALGRLLDGLGTFVVVAAFVAALPRAHPLQLAVGLGCVLWTVLLGGVAAIAAQENRSGHIEACVAIGLPTSRIVLRHLLPVIIRRSMPMFLALAALVVGAMGAADFLGLGFRREASLGTMLFESLSHLQSTPLKFLLALVANVVSVASLGCVAAASSGRRAASM